MVTSVFRGMVKPLDHLLNEIAKRIALPPEFQPTTVNPRHIQQIAHKLFESPDLSVLLRH
jgi:hypothetical protein